MATLDNEDREFISESRGQSAAPTTPGGTKADSRTETALKALGIRTSQWAQDMVTAYGEAKKQRMTLSGLETKAFGKAAASLRLTEAAKARAGMTLSSALKSPKDAFNSLSAVMLKSGAVTKNFEAVQNVVGMAFPKMAASMAGGMGRMAIAGAGVGIVGLILAKIGDAIIKTMKGGLEVNKAFNRALIESNDGLGRNVDLYARAALAGTMYGVTQEEITSGLGELTDAYALNSWSMTRAKDAQATYLSNVAVSLTKTIGMAKGLGWTAQQTSAVSAQLAILGAKNEKFMENLTGPFAEFVATAKNAGMNVGDFAEVLSALTPVSLYTTDALDRTNKFFVNLGIALRATNMEAGNAISRQVVFSKALKDFGKAAAAIDLPSLLAFGGGMQAGMPGGLGGAMKAGMGALKPQVLKDQLKFVMESIGDQGDRVAGASIWMTQQLRLPLESSNAIAELLDREMRAGAMSDKQKAELGLTNGQKQLDSMIETSMASNALKDPMQRVADAIEKILGFLTSGLARSGLGMMGRMIKAAPVGMK